MEDDLVHLLDVAAEVAAFDRGGAQCWVNTGTADVTLPAGASVVLASSPGVDGVLPGDTAVWLQTRGKDFLL